MEPRGAEWADPRINRLSASEEDRSASNPLLTCLARKGYIPGYEDLTNSVIRPPRDMYSTEELGPPYFVIDERECIRNDVSLKNVGGYTLECSHYLPSPDLKRRWPCVVFCHGNSSSRLEAYDCVQVCLPRGLSVFSFDFSGCGLSEGQYVTLGHVEQRDLAIVLRYLRESGLTTSIAVWGRSMGAATAILTAAKDHHLTAVVLDSPFTRLRTVAHELGNKAIPRFMLNLGIDLLRDEVRARTGANLDDLSPIDVAHEATCPAIFGASVEYDFIQAHHAKDLQLVWGGKSDMYYFNGGHNDSRPSWFMQEAADWLLMQFYPTQAASPTTVF